MLLIFLVPMICFRCSIQPKIEGEFGVVRAPNSGQVARINLKNGDTFLAGKIQEDNGTLLFVLLDYSAREISITVRGKSPRIASNPSKSGEEAIRNL